MNKTKEKILDISLELFLEKGFDETSISDILARLSIARGTLYYHFISKEAIMEAIIERFGDAAVEEAVKVAKNRKLSAYEKLFALFSSMDMRRITGVEQVLDYLHRPQNALFHEKSGDMILEKITPLLADIIREGIEEGVFDTDFPEETAALILIMIIGISELKGDDEPVHEQDKEQVRDQSEAQADSSDSYIYPPREMSYRAVTCNIERMLGAKAGSFAALGNLQKKD